MSNQTKVKLGPHGIYVRADGRDFRPGTITNLVRVDMSDGGLAVGDQVRAHHLYGTSRCKVTLPDGRVLIWHDDYQHELEATKGPAPAPPEDEQQAPAGLRH